MNKQDLIAEIVAALTADLENYARSAKSAHAEATDEQSKAENKYDTRGLEASYLARGQSRQAMEVVQALEQYGTMPVRDFGPDDTIDLGALVQLEAHGERLYYFLGPSAGGTEVTCEGQAVIVITPPSPMGQKLIGRTLRTAGKPAKGEPRLLSVE